MRSQPLGERSPLRNRVSPFTKCLVANLLSPRQRPGAHRGLLFSLPQANLWVWRPLETGVSCTHVGYVHTHTGMHTHTTASLFSEEAFPQVIVAIQPSLLSRGHFWGSHSLVDTSLSLAMDVGESWGPALQPRGIFQERLCRGWQSYSGGRTLPFSSPGEHSLRAPGDDPTAEEVDLLQVGEEGVQRGARGCQPCAHLHQHRHSGSHSGTSTTVHSGTERHSRLHTSKT